MCSLRHPAGIFVTALGGTAIFPCISHVLCSACNQKNGGDRRTEGIGGQMNGGDEIWRGWRYGGEGAEEEEEIEEGGKDEEEEEEKGGPGGEDPTGPGQAPAMAQSCCTPSLAAKAASSY